MGPFDDEIGSGEHYIGANNTLSPQRNRNVGNFATADDLTTNDNSRHNNYQSAQKIRLTKKTQAETTANLHNGLSSTINSNDASETLPRVRGASN